MESTPGDVRMGVQTAPKPDKWIGARHKQALLMFLGLVVAYSQRVNVSVGLVAMTDPDVNSDYPTLNYTTAEKGTISGMFFYGYVATGIPAGMLADKYGAVKLLAIIGGMFCGFGSVAMPYAATNIGFWAVCTLRILQGLGQGFFIPCINSHVGKWAIPAERAQFSWLWTGSQMGTIIMLIVGGQLATGAGGWPSIFYYSGVFSIVWGIFCLIFGADSPAKHKRITKEERDYILTNLELTSANKKPKSIPWKSIITSGPFMILVFAFWCQNWGFFTLLTLMPTYIHGVFDFSIAANGLLSALPYLGMMLGGIFVSFVVNTCSGKVSVNVIRKVSNSIGFYGCAIPLLALAIFDTGATAAIILLIAATTANSGMYNGIQCNHLDLAPNFGGILMGITNGLSNIAAIVAPQWAGFVVKDESNAEQWQIVFLVAAAIFALGNTAFLILGSTQVQPWNDSGEPSKGDIELEAPNVPDREEHL